MFQKLGSKILTGKGLGLLGGAGAAAFAGTRYTFVFEENQMNENIVS